MFLGFSFSGTDTALQTTPPVDGTINIIKIKNIVLDELYLTKDILIKYHQLRLPQSCE